MTYKVDPSFPGPERFKGAVQVVMQDGTVFEAIEEHNRGSAENPMTHEELVDKFERNAEGVLDAQQRKRLIEATMDLDNATQASVLVELSLPEGTCMKGKCALITGSTSGLGAATAARLAEEGCNIVLNGFGARSEIEAQRRELEDTHGVRVLYHDADLAHPAEIGKLMQTAIETFGAVDILVNNAVVRHFSPVHEFPVAAWDRSLAVNVSSAFHTIRLALPEMIARGWGRIINMSSIYGLIGAVNRVDYVTSEDRADRHDARGRARVRANRDHVQRRVSGLRVDAGDRRARARDHVQRWRCA